MGPQAQKTGCFYLYKTKFECQFNVIVFLPRRIVVIFKYRESDSQAALLQGSRGTMMSCVDRSAQRRITQNTAAASTTDSAPSHLTEVLTGATHNYENVETQTGTRVLIDKHAEFHLVTFITRPHLI